MKLGKQFTLLTATDVARSSDRELWTGRPHGGWNNLRHPVLWFAQCDTHQSQLVAQGFVSAVTLSRAF